jgi:hypothetical protein
LGSISSTTQRTNMTHTKSATPITSTSKKANATATKTKGRNNDKNVNHQRTVLLPGPHKSASTSVQTYLVNLYNEGILSSYNWEWVGSNYSNGFSDLARQLLYEFNNGYDTKNNRMGEWGFVHDKAEKVESYRKEVQEM